MRLDPPPSADLSTGPEPTQSRPGAQGDPPARSFDIAVIGSGSGNSIPGGDLVNSQVAVIEEGTFGGTCINVGCIPTKMFVYTAERAELARGASRFGVDLEVRDVRWADIRDRIFDRIDPVVADGRRYRQRGADNVTLYTGHAQFANVQPTDGQYRLEISGGMGQQILLARQVVLATGSRPTIPAVVAESGVPFHTSDTVMRISRLPRRMTILGAGYIAAELGHVFHSLGVEVSVIARSSGMLFSLDEDISARYTKAVTEKWRVYLQQVVKDITGDDTEQRVTLGDGTTVHSDLLLVATGRQPNSDRLGLEHVGVAVDPDGVVIVDRYQRTRAPGIWALGDVANYYQLKHVANHEQRVVAHNLAHPDQMQESDHRFVPAAVFTSPQVAAVGLTERQAREQGIDVTCSVQDYGGTAYGWAMEDSASICKLVADRATGMLIGAQLLGPDASILIQPLIQAMSLGLSAKLVARGQYWIHPALTEVVENALLGLDLP